MKFRELLIRFKRRLTYEDLAYLTNDAIAAVVQTEQGKKLLELGSVKNADDKWTVDQLNNRVAPILLAVSSVPSRRAQAQIFRKHMKQFLRNQKQISSYLMTRNGWTFGLNIPMPKTCR